MVDSQLGLREWEDFKESLRDSVVGYRTKNKTSNILVLDHHLAVQEKPGLWNSIKDLEFVVTPEKALPFEGRKHIMVLAE